MKWNERNNLKHSNNLLILTDKGAEVFTKQISCITTFWSTITTTATTTTNLEMGIFHTKQLLIYLVDTFVLHLNQCQFCFFSHLRTLSPSFPPIWQQTLVCPFIICPRSVCNSVCVCICVRACWEMFIMLVFFRGLCEDEGSTQKKDSAFSVCIQFIFLPLDR